MTMELHSAPPFTVWEELFLRSVALESGANFDPGVGLVLDGEEAAISLDHESGAIALGGALEWHGAWDVSPALVSTRHRDGARIVVVAARDIDGRVEALMMESAHAAALSGRTLRLVGIGEGGRGSRAVQHLLPSPEPEELLRLLSVAAAILRLEESSVLLGRAAERAGCDSIGIGPGATGDHAIASYSSIELIEALDRKRRTAKDESPFAPDLIRRVRERMRG